MIAPLTEAPPLPSAADKMMRVLEAEASAEHTPSYSV